MRTQNVDVSKVGLEPGIEDASENRDAAECCVHDDIDPLPNDLMHGKSHSIAFDNYPCSWQHCSGVAKAWQQACDGIVSDPEASARNPKHRIQLPGKPFKTFKASRMQIIFHDAASTMARSWFPGCGSAY